MTRHSHQKSRVGVVVSNKMQKTIVVAVESFRHHRVYKKILRRTRRFKVHDETNACALGDVVRIVETRPMSAEKRWRVAEVLVRGQVAEVAPREIDAELIGQERRPSVERPREAAAAEASAVAAAPAAVEEVQQEAVEEGAAEAADAPPAQAVAPEAEESEPEIGAAEEAAAEEPVEPLAEEAPPAVGEEASPVESQAEERPSAETSGEGAAESAEEEAPPEGESS